MSYVSIYTLNNLERIFWDAIYIIIIVNVLVLVILKMFNKNKTVF